MCPTLHVLGHKENIGHIVNIYIHISYSTCSRDWYLYIYIYYYFCRGETWPGRIFTMAAMIIGGAFYGDLGCLILEMFNRCSTDFNRLCLVLLDLLGLHWNHYRNLGMLMLLNESFPNMFADGPCNPRSNEMQHGSTSRSVTLRLRCAGRWIATGYVVGNISVILASNDVPRASTEGGYGGRVGVHMTGW